MGSAVVTLKIMPTSPDVDLEALEKRALEVVTKFNGGKGTKVEQEPVAFGLKAINLMFMMDENLGSPDSVAETVETFEEVNSASIVDVRRALG